MDRPQQPQRDDGLRPRPARLSDPSLWFDRELKSRFGVDVFAHSYDFERGWVIVSNRQVVALVTRVEDLNRSLIAGLGQFLDKELPDARVENANAGQVKWYAGTIRSVKSSYNVSPDVLDSVVRTKYFQHFYGRETEDIRSRWGA
jgi:hypothetical protein